jgi:integrase
MKAEAPIWFAPRSCWRKRYGGKTFYFKGTADEAAAQWQTKKAEIDGRPADPLTLLYRSEAERATKQAKFYAMVGEDDSAQRCKTFAAGLIKAVKSKDPLQALTPAAPISEAGAWIWADRLRTVEQVQPSTTETDFFTACQMFLAQKKAEAVSGTITAGRHNALSAHLDIVKEIVGCVPLKSIGGAAIEDFYTALTAREEMSTKYAEDVFCTFRQMLNWCGDREIYAAPAVLLRKKKWTFSKGTQLKAAKPKRPLLSADIKRMLKVAKPEMQCFILLALNTGMTQQDLADLQPEEVDWKNGRLTRVRSKLKTNSTAQTINYVLWSATFTLLKRFGKKTGERVFVSRNGTAIKSEGFNDAGDYIKNDNLGQTFLRFKKAHFPKLNATFKSFRSTGSGILQGTAYADMRVFYLGDSPRTVLDRSYSPGSSQFQARFDEAIKTLGQELNLT